MTTGPKLFKALTLGGKKNPIQLSHRVAITPLTLLRAGDSGVQPDYTATYYAQRATPDGLIIAEATDISASARGYLGGPGIFNQEQIDAWKHMTQAVHDKGGVIFLQIWHTGRTSHPLLQPNGELPVSSSRNMPLDDSRIVPTSAGASPLMRPRALETHEIPLIVEDFRKAAVNAIAVGFDGVELHGANGYLLKQFLFDGINDCTVKYGGSAENYDAIMKASNCRRFQDRVVIHVNEYDLAYAHIAEPRTPHYPNELTPAEGATAYFRKIYKDVLVSAGGYDRQSALTTVETGDADVVALDRYFISNPDLVKRFELDAPLAAWDDSTFYVGGEAGYTDYAILKQE